MENIRSEMKTDGESLKSLVDTVVSENMKQLDLIEQSLLEDLNTQDKTFDNYITYLNYLANELNICLSPTEPHKLMFAKKPKIHFLLETTKPATPGFTAGQYSKSDVTKLLGKIRIPKTEGEKREIKSMDSVYNTAMKPTHQQMKENNKKSTVKQTLSLSSSVTKVRLASTQHTLLPNQQGLTGGDEEERLKSPGTTRQEKNYRTYRGITMDRN
ncbi:uncharacterized protein LOC134247546, partial [Saccostrea cucullata]|uniref:uncharacterized protein LOC134247546 n=1 Tax=Saccostrea cuccullata TaxID=36930 RepID=UPI002ED3A636